MPSHIPCLVCNTVVFDTDNQSLSLSSSDSEYKKKITIFLLRYLLEISKPVVVVGKEPREDNGQCSRFLVTCEHCEETIKQASLIYSQIRDLAKKFRGIQKKVVEALRTSSSCSGVWTDDVEHCRNLVKNYDYNGFGFPFMIEDPEGLEPSSTINVSGSYVKGNEDDLDLSKTDHYEVVVKQEEEEENSGSQKILLIFPEEDQKVEEDEQGSQEDSESEEDDDYDNQVSEETSEDEDDDQVDSEEEEDDEHNLDPPQNAQADKSKEINSNPSNSLFCSFICKKCLQRFATNKELDEHNKMAHFKEKRGTFPCPLEGCDRTYTYSGISPQHFRTRHSDPPFICKDCKQEFSNPDQVRIHHKQTHPPLPTPKKPAKRSLPEKPAKVPKGCGRPKKPKKVGKPHNPFPCPLCNHSLKTFTILKMHLKRSHPNNPIPLNELKLKFFPPPSPKAEDPQVTPFELKYPHIICKRNSSGKLPCPWSEDPSPCPKIFPRKYQLHRHITVHHLNLPMYTCNWSVDEGGGGPVCGKTFATRNNYLEHCDRHRGTPKYKCDDCQLTFFRRNHFTRHMERIHSSDKFICEECGRGFSCREYLNQHRSAKHKGKVKKDNELDKDGDPGIICDLCGQLLKNKLTLRVHVLAKHDKVPGKYCCHLCDKRFRASSYLNLHLWTRHAYKVEGYEPKEIEPRKYCCHLCVTPTRFGQKTYLNKHLWERHQFKVEGYQPKEKVKRKDKLQCEVTGCRRLFLREENLERHGKEVHGEDGKKPGPWNCKHCGKNYFYKEKWEHCEKRHENKESRPEKCEICGKGFPTKHYLRFHQKHTHKMELGDKRGWRRGAYNKDK